MTDNPAGNIDVDINIKSTFLNMARWTSLLAVMFIIAMGGIGLVLGIMLFANAADVARLHDGATAMTYAMGTIMMLIGIGINVYPVYALFKYSSTIKLAIELNDKELFHRAVIYLKDLFRYIVIATIVSVGIYLGLVVIVAMVSELL